MKNDISKAVFNEDEIKKASPNGNRGHPDLVPGTKIPAAAANSAHPLGQLSNSSIIQIPPEVKRENDNLTKTHI